VVATFPFTIELSVSEFVLVDTVNTFVVPEAMILDKSVLVATPLTIDVSTVPAVDREFVVLLALIAARAAFVLEESTNAPVIVVVPFKVVLFEVRELVLILLAVVVPSRFRSVNPSMVVVDTMPSTIDVIVFVLDEKDRLFVVVADISDARLVVDITPFTFVVMIPVLVAKVT
jgi:hypothetical protein